MASTTIDKLLDFAFNTPADPLRSVDCVKQRCDLIDKIWNISRASGSKPSPLPERKRHEKDQHRQFVLPYHGRIGDLLFANLLWLVCCLPVITAGASTLGLFTVVNKMAAKEDYTVRTDFFKAFKRDFKQATASG